MPCVPPFSKWPSPLPPDPLDQDCNCHVNAMTCSTTQTPLNSQMQQVVQHTIAASSYQAKNTCT